MSCPPLEVPTVRLVGVLVRLEPLSWAHLDGLCEVGLHPQVWRWASAQIETRDDMRGYLQAALASAESGREVPFATVEQSSGRVVGSTRYLAIERDHCRLEIGYTWVAPPWQGTGVNTEAKLLQLEHAFEHLGCHRVEFKTDSFNERSQRALRGIGATEEGTFRNHMVTQGGRLRHSVYFSIIDSEWPAVKSRLQDRLGPR